MINIQVPVTIVSDQDVIFWHVFNFYSQFGYNDKTINNLNYKNSPHILIITCRVW